ncbi:MAG: methylated-DNA--[protein]-cysteine S-methyltransferase [Planctomycetaceae bacterium]|nr:methylated-DNA--[protein]-cysteine S-methyltransferase [Planctomycetaceae bacterium]
MLVFSSRLGWMAIAMADQTVLQLVFGHPSAGAACRAIYPELRCKNVVRRGHPLIRRLQAYASGQRDNFSDVPVDFGSASEFRCRVLAACRRIGYGETLSYAQLAAKAGFPGAARAVGNCMAGNGVPLVVPCHRVVCADGQLGRYSAPGGISTKRRLLVLESESLS